MLLGYVTSNEIEQNTYKSTLIKVNRIPIGIVDVYTKKGDNERQYVEGSFINELAKAVGIMLKGNYSPHIYINIKEWVEKQGGIVEGECKSLMWTSSDYYNLVFPSFTSSNVTLVKEVSMWEDIGGKREPRQFRPDKDSLAKSILTTVNGENMGHYIIHEPQYQEPYIHVDLLVKIAEMFEFPKPDYQYKFIELFPWVLQHDGIVQIVNPYDKNKDHLIITFPGKKILYPETNSKGFFSKIISKFKSLRASS